jgi:hypothetical protein
VYRLLPAPTPPRTRELCARCVGTYSCPIPSSRLFFFSLSDLAPSCAQSSAGARVYHVTDYGADPTGAADATDAINKAIADAFRPPSNATMTGGIPDLGGAEVHLDGGTYLIKGPLTLPASGGGNFKVAIHHPWSYIQLPSHTRLGA